MPPHPHVAYANPKVLRNPESIERVRASWVNARELMLELGVKSHHVRQVVMGCLIYGRKLNASLEDQLSNHPHFNAPFPEMTFSEILGEHWRSEYIEEGEFEDVFIPTSLKRRIFDEEQQHKIKPYDLRYKITSHPAQLAFHPIFKEALSVYMLHNSISRPLMSPIEHHWISTLELFERLKSAEPPISISYRTLVKKLNGWGHDEELSIELKTRSFSEWRPVDRVLGIRQSSTGGPPGWRVDLRAFSWIYDQLQEERITSLNLNDEENVSFRGYASVSKFSKSCSSEEMTRNYIYTRGTPIVQHWHQVLQQNPQGGVVHYKFEGRPRRFTLHCDSIIYARTQGQGTLHISPLLKRYLLQILRDGVTVQDFEGAYVKTP